MKLFAELARFCALGALLLLNPAAVVAMTDELVPPDEGFVVVFAAVPRVRDCDCCDCCCCCIVDDDDDDGGGGAGCCWFITRVVPKRRLMKRIFDQKENRRESPALLERERLLVVVPMMCMLCVLVTDNLPKTRMAKVGRPAQQCCVELWEGLRGIGDVVGFFARGFGL